MEGEERWCKLLIIFFNLTHTQKYRARSLLPERRYHLSECTQRKTSLRGRNARNGMDADDGDKDEEEDGGDKDEEEDGGDKDEEEDGGDKDDEEDGGDKDDEEDGGDE